MYRHLIDAHGANLWLSNADGDTPLLLAASLGSIRMTEVRGATATR